MKLLPEIKLRNPFATRYDNVDRGDMVNPFTIVDYSDPYGMFGLFKRLKIYSEAADTISIVSDSVFGMERNTEINLMRLAKEFLPTTRFIRKGLFCHPFQVDETHLMQYDAIVLLSRLVTPEQLERLVKRCQKRDIEIILEIDSEPDMSTLKAYDEKQQVSLLINQRDIITGAIDYNKADTILGSMINELHFKEVILASGIELGIGINLKPKHYKNVDYALVGSYLMGVETEHLELYIPKIMRMLGNPEKM